MQLIMLFEEYSGQEFFHCAHPNIKHLAEILDRHAIAYIYQSQLIRVDLKDRTKKLAPDLLLPEYQTVIVHPSSMDYFDGGSRIIRLERIYQDNHYHFIPLHPDRQSTPNSPFPVLKYDEYERYVFDSIEKFMEQRLEVFRRKIKSRNDE